MANKPKLSPAQSDLLTEIEAAGVLYVCRWGRYNRTATALVRKGVAVVSEPDYSRNGQDGYSIVTRTEESVQENRMVEVKQEKVLTAEERLHSCSLRIAEASSVLTQAVSWLENWPGEDDEGSRFSDNMRQTVDGIAQALDSLAELIWARRIGIGKP